MIIADFLKKILRWLWPSLIVIVLSCVRKIILESLTLVQIQEGLFLYAGYLLCVIPLGMYLSKSKWFNDESKAALMIVFITYVFLEYSAIVSTWEQFAGHWVERYFNNRQNTVFILSMALCGLGLIWVLRKMNDKRRNRALLLFTTLVLAIVPFIDLLLAPSYNFDSDLFHIPQSNIAATLEVIPQRIFWIILDEHPSSFMLNEIWGYKDTTFRKGLESLGFTVYDSCVSNYNYTPFSIAATTYGAMLPINGPQFINVQRQNLLGQRIRQSPVFAFFKMQRYGIRNLSLFDNGFKKYFTHQGEIVNSSVVGMLFSKLDKQYAMPQLFYNRKIIDSLHILLNYIPNNHQRIFVYAHVLMPHEPYLPLEINFTHKKRQLFASKDDQAFLNFVRYTDSTILNMLHNGFDSLSSDQKSNTLVILQADHGYRYLQKGGKDLRWRSSFGILNAVLWPKNSKVKFYNGMSSVNTFRILFRDVWEINLSTLSDSSANVCPLIKTEIE
jgi:Sulfatase